MKPSLPIKVSTRAASRIGLLAAAACLAGCGTTGRGAAPQQPPQPETERAAPPPAEYAAAAPAPAAAGPATLELTLEEAVLLAMGNNRSLHVEYFQPMIRRTAEDIARAAFDPALSAALRQTRTRPPPEARSASDTDATAAEAGISVVLPAGTRLAAGVETEESASGTNAAAHSARAGLSVTQSLLRGAGLGPNLAELRQARLDTRISEYELRGTAEALAARVEQRYWDYVVALRKVRIVEESLKLAEQQREETLHRIRVGGLAETEAAAADAEVAARKESLINAASRVETLRVQLLRLIKPELTAAGLSVKLVPLTEPPAPEEKLGEAEEHIALALRMRPDLNQARLLARRGELELVRTANGLLPRLDLFAKLGKTGYADSFAAAFNNIGNGGYDFAVGLELDWPMGDRAANARHRRARFTQEQLLESLRNMQDLVCEDVQLAYIEAQRARKQLDATAATSALQAEKLRAETTKFRVGKSTALLVAQAQRDLLNAQTAEVEAVAAYFKSLTELFRLEGSLLERRGIGAPGREPAE